MGVALSGIEDSEFNVYAVGPAQINSFAVGFCNLSENTLKQRGIKTRFHKVPQSFVEDNISKMNYLAFLSTPNQKTSRLATFAEDSGVEVGIFRY
jgi:hypothetical protein